MSSKIAPNSAGNAKVKEEIWLKTADDVNSVSNVKRGTGQIKHEWHDWNYNIKSTSWKKNISALDKELLDLQSSVIYEQKDTANGTDSDRVEEKQLLASSIEKKIWRTVLHFQQQNHNGA